MKKIWTNNTALPQHLGGLVFLTALVCLHAGILCCAWMNMPAHMINLKHLLFGVVVLVLGLGACLWQARQTWRYMQQIETLGDEELPPRILNSLNRLELEASRIILIRTAKPLIFCFGFWQPRICISTGAIERLSPDQIDAVLLHEEWHRQRRDPLRLLLLEAVGIALFFLPMIQEWAAIAKIQIELRADQHAISKVGKAPLAGALYVLLADSSLVKQDAGIAIAGLSANTVRVARLLGQREPHLRISLRALLTSAAILWILCLLLMM